MTRGFKAFLELTKTGIIVFAVFSALAGYALSLHEGLEFNLSQPFLLVIGLYFVCAGSFALNQTQEWRKDQKMNRTRHRPVPQGLISPAQGYLISVLFLLVGHFFLFVLEPRTGALALLTVVLYNGLYTMYWKPKLIFGAVPGAIPGAMPAVIGYSVNESNLLDPTCIYIFLVMFLWQMPHFWSLAMRYTEDYRQGGFPVLPVLRGGAMTLYQIGLYTFLYVAIAVASPLFVKANLAYLILVVPISLKLLWEFFKYFRSEGRERWLHFFLWVNLSLMAYLSSPVIDKWLLLYRNSIN